MQPLEDEARAEAARRRRPAATTRSSCWAAASAPPVPPLRPDPELNDSADRVWHAARLFHRGVAPRIIVSGGSYPVASGRRAADQTEADGDARSS